MDLRKAALIATWFIFWLASLVLLFYNAEGLELGPWSFFGNILNGFGLSLDPVIFGFWLDYSARLPIPLSMIFAMAIHDGFVCSSAGFWIIGICKVGSVKIGIWLMIVSNLIKFISIFIIYR